MIEAKCDKCGKREVLIYSEFGLVNPRGWKIETQSFPTRRDLAYKVFCSDCNPDVARKVEE